MFKKTLSFMAELADLYSKNRVARASAALSYYFTMTVFPLIICLYTLLGSNYAKAVEALDFVASLLTPEVLSVVNDFMNYVSSSYSPAMLAAGIAVLITSSSAAVRSIQATIGEMQGGQRFQGFADFIFSIVFSLIFLASMYFAVLVILTGREILGIINSFLPFVDISNSWDWLRFIFLAGILFVISWGIYGVSKRKIDRYHTFPGALIAMIGIVGMSYIFSVFIGESAKYPLVYGSLASVILLMFWLFMSCQIIYIGAAFNITLRNIREKSGKYE